MDNGKRVEHHFFLVIFLFVFVAVFLTFLPYLGALVIGSAFAIVFYPLNKKILSVVKRRGAAAFLTILVVLIIFLAPLVFFGAEVLGEARELYLKVSADNDFNFRSLEQKFQFLGPIFKLDFKSYLQKFLDWFIGNLGAVFSGVVDVVMTFIISTVTFYYLLKDGSKFKEAVTSLSPLQQKFNASIFEKLQASIDSVMKGSLGTAIAQGISAGLGFAVLGIPNPALWGSVAVFAALIPSFGTALVIVPAALYLFVIGRAISGVALLLWGGLVVGLLDNFLRPYLMERGMRIHPFFVLLSVLGGISFWGPLGFILGPITLSLFFALLHIYPILVLGREET